MNESDVDNPSSPDEDTTGARSGRRGRAVGHLVILALIVTGAVVAVTVLRRLSPDSRGLLPAEFENHQALLVGWPENCSADQAQTLASILSIASKHLTVLVTLPTPDSAGDVRQSFIDGQTALENIRFLKATVDVPWVRDHGPMVIKTFQGGYEVVHVESPGTRPIELADKVAAELNIPVTRAALRLAGGNLLTNGSGLVVTTKRTLEWNRGRDQAKIDALLKKHFGANQVVALEPLHQEPSGHVDVFATFTGPDTIVVGQYLPAEDARNAKILDDNAARLATVKVSTGPLRVVRIRMPARNGAAFRSYTQVVYANGVLFVPSFAEVEPALEQQALAVYKSVLPDWQLVPIAGEPAKENRTLARAVTLNLYRTSRDEPYDSAGR